MSEPPHASPPAAPDVEPVDRGPAGRWAILMAVTLAVIAIVSQTWRPAYRQVKRHRGVRMARSSLETLAGGDLPTAMRLAQTAGKLAPGEVEVARAIGMVCAKTGQSSGMEFWDSVVRSGQATHDDWVAAIGLAVRLGRLDRSGPWLEQAIKIFPDDRPLLRHALGHLIRMGNRTKAIAFARQLLRQFPSDDQTQLDLGRLLAGGISPESEAEGETLLWEIAAGNSPFRDPALEALAAMRHLGRTRTEALARLIETRTNLPLAIRLRGLDLRARLDPDSKAALARTAMGIVPTNRGAGDTAALAGWLNRNGASTEALSLLADGPCRTNAALMSAKLDALLALGRFDEIDAVAAQADGPINRPISLVVSGIAAIRANRAADGEAKLREALKMQPPIPAIRLLVGSQAERLGLVPVAIEAYQGLLEFPELALDAARCILRLAQPRDDLSLTLETLRFLSAYMPGEESVAGERAWLEAVFGTEKEFALATLGNLAKSRTNQPGWRYGLALAMMRNGDAAGGLALAEQPPVEWESMEPRWQAAYVALLGASQQREAARRFARRIDQKKLRLQERGLVTPWL